MSADTLAQGRRLLRQLRAMLWPHRWNVVAVLVLILLVSLVEGVSLSLLVPLTQAFTITGSSGEDATDRLFHVYQEQLAGYTVEQRLAVLGIALLSLFSLKGVLQYLRELLSSRLWIVVGTETRTRVLASVLQRPYSYFLARKQGTMVQRFYHEPFHAAIVVQMGVELVANLCMLMVLIGLLVLVSWKVTAFVLAVGVLYGLGIWRLSRRAHAGGAERQTVEAEAMSLLSEAIGGIRQIKVFSAERRIQAAYERWVQQYRELHMRYWVVALLPHRLTEVFWIGILAVLLGLPALGTVHDVRSILPILAVFSAVAFRGGPYVARISQGWLTVKFFLPAVQVVDQLLEPVEQITRCRKGRQFYTLVQGIQYENVSFSYDSGRPVLTQVSVHFNRGETTAIIGPSGAGKSTLVDLLVGLYEPTVGRILVDGVDLREYDPASWLGAIGLVSQDTFIFHGTIRENIGFACSGATLEQIMTAAGQANAHDFIERCPDGYETVVGDRGLKLSGGERQRIAIARALVRNPQLLIFDEATSALDNQSEALVQEAIARIARDRTVIVIAHRLSTVIRADKIVVLVGGTVVEEGTHASLLKGNGAYSALYGRELAKEPV